MSDVTFTLSEPIEAHGDTLKALKLRKPTPADARAVKALPYQIAQDESVQINPDAAAKYIERLAGIPGSSVASIDIVDFNNLCWTVAGFFMNSGSAKSSS
ncbi:conserved hypothetical protein [Paraburkholderia tropica]|uniref:phage tail assembly protein n=1 Tax=Paraburkholderia tropica TaxID=92647 RepID=UPI001CB10DA7|nr:phage tail assembly protein [Paraburkholderia tropica]CAG9195897.1 conserved hypothetical protein [Paraburkholderia tropica]